MGATPFPKAPPTFGSTSHPSPPKKTRYSRTTIETELKEEMHSPPPEDRGFSQSHTHACIRPTQLHADACGLCVVPPAPTALKIKGACRESNERARESARHANKNNSNRLTTLPQIKSSQGGETRMKKLLLPVLASSRRSPTRSTRRSRTSTSSRTTQQGGAQAPRPHTPQIIHAHTHTSTHNSLPGPHV